MIDALRRYFDSKRAELDEELAREDFGWTPCPHYLNAIGWCPLCVSQKARWLEATARMRDEFPLGGER